MNNSYFLPAVFMSDIPFPSDFPTPPQRVTRRRNKMKKEKMRGAISFRAILGHV